MTTVVTGVMLTDAGRPLHGTHNVTSPTHKTVVKQNVEVLTSACVDSISLSVELLLLYVRARY